MYAIQHTLTLLVRKISCKCLGCGLCVWLRLRLGLSEEGGLAGVLALRGRLCESGLSRNTAGGGVIPQGGGNAPAEAAVWASGSVCASALAQYYSTTFAQYTNSPPDPCFICHIHHTLLVMTISCKCLGCGLCVWLRLCLGLSAILLHGVCAIYELPARPLLYMPYTIHYWSRQYRVNA